MTLVNLTPHPVRVYSVETPDRIADPAEGLILEIPPSGTVARLATIDLGTWSRALHEGHSVPIEGVEYGHPVGLPPKTAEDAHYIVSLAFALAVSHRDDVLVPYGDVRNSEGALIGCKLLARVAG